MPRTNDRPGDALPALLCAIAAGREYPDAQLAVTQRFRITAEQLQSQYDLFTERERINCDLDEFRALTKRCTVHGHEHIFTKGDYSVSLCMLPCGVYRLFDTSPGACGMTFAQTFSEAYLQALRIAGNMTSGVYDHA